MVTKELFASICLITGCTGGMMSASGEPPPLSDAAGSDVMVAPDAGLTPDASVPDALVPTEVTGQIDFPPPGATISATVPVRGSIQSDEPVLAVWVGEALAESDDGFASWTATADLTLGDNTVSVAVETEAGRSVVAEIEIQRAEGMNTIERGVTSRYGEIGHHVFPGVNALAYDHENNRVFASDGYGKGVWYVDLATGDQHDLTRGVEGLPFNHPRQIAYVPVNNRVYAVLKDEPGYVLEVNPEDGSRRLVPGIEGANDVAWITGTDEVAITAMFQDTLYAYNTRTEETRVISSPTVGSGEEFGRYAPLQVIVDAENNRVLVTALTGGKVLAIDLTSGDREVVSDRDDGPMGAQDLTYWAGQEEAFSQSYNSSIAWDDEPIYALNVATGARRQLDFGDDGMRMTMARGIVSYPHGILYASVFGIYALDSLTGARVMISGVPFDPESDDGRECLPDCTYRAPD